MITPEQIAERARRIWISGRVLSACVAADAAPFPWIIPFARPSAREWLEDYAQLRATTERLEASSKAVTGSGYTLTTATAGHQKLGRLRTVESIAFDSAEDVAASAGEMETLRRFRHAATRLCTLEPRLLPWIARKPFALLEHESALPRLLAVVEHFSSNPRPLRYARELGIAGVDSKFIEAHRSVLADWLDALLPSSAIDDSARGLSDYGFERRYGLRYEEPLLRFRWLDRKRAFGGTVVDIATPLSQFTGYAPSCARVFVTENRISYLTLPDCEDSLVVFGGGYAIDLLAAVRWLGNQPLCYWGDIDTHGFSILSRLRAHWPSTRSFLMDRRTLMSHREMWSEEPQGGRFLGALQFLDSNEAALCEDLRKDSLGLRIRLEQERIGFQDVQNAMMRIKHSTDRVFSHQCP